MGVFDEAMEMSKLQVKNGAMALEAQLKTADEARTANLIAMYVATGQLYTDAYRARRTELEKQIWERLGIKD